MPNQSTTAPSLYLTPQNSSVFFLASMLVVSAASSTLHFPWCVGDTQLRRRMNHACTSSCHALIIAKPSLCPPSTKSHPDGQGSASYARAQVEPVLQGKPQPQNFHSGAHLFLAKYVALSTLQNNCKHFAPRTWAAATSLLLSNILFSCMRKPKAHQKHSNKLKSFLFLPTRKLTSQFNSKSFTKFHAPQAQADLDRNRGRAFFLSVDMVLIPSCRLSHGP